MASLYLTQTDSRHMIQNKAVLLNKSCQMTQDLKEKSSKWLVV